MSGRRMRVSITPAQMREHARKHIKEFWGPDRMSVAFNFMEHLATNPDYFYTTAQMKAAAEGLRAGMDGK